MNKIFINMAILDKNRISYDYKLQGEWEKYFNMREKMWIEYSQELFSIPASIAVVPLLTNILPISWLCDAEIVVDELDKDFYESILEFKKGYISMYPNLSFKGKLNVGKLIDNKEEKILTKSSGVFFSGGVDAFSTLFAHIEEKPTLITLWGADLTFDDQIGWDRVKKHIKEVSKLYKLDNLFIKTNFRYFINEKKLNELVLKSGDGWWHGFQCGIGLVGHAAPYAFENKMYRVYIASSYTPDYKGTTASVPTTDGKVRFSTCSIYHDQYEINRQEKIENIVNYSKNNDKVINLRVCWKSSGGSNCCSCEKCYRTMMGLIAENADPKNFGFLYTENVKKEMIHDLKRKIVVETSTTLPFWKDIHQRFLCNQNENSIKKDFDWFLKMDIDKFNNSFPKIIRRLMMKGKRMYLSYKNV